MDSKSESHSDIIPSIVKNLVRAQVDPGQVEFLETIVSDQIPIRDLHTVKDRVQFLIKDLRCRSIYAHKVIGRIQCIQPLCSRRVPPGF